MKVCDIEFSDAQTVVDEVLRCSVFRFQTANVLQGVEAVKGDVTPRNPKVVAAGVESHNGLVEWKIAPSR